MDGGKVLFRRKRTSCHYSNVRHRHIERKVKSIQAGEIVCGEVVVEGSGPEKEVRGRI